MDASSTDKTEQPVEVFEHTPWAQLAVAPEKKKTWLIYLAAGAIAVAAVGALISRSIGRTPDYAVESVPVTAPAPVVTTPLPPLAETELLTEADLRAVTPGRGELSAAARAEWFVTDYFSTGGNPGAHSSVVDAIGRDLSFPATEAAGGSSYVDWAATSRVEAIGNDQFRSTVLFRMLVSDEAGGYVRLPVEAVDVVVEVDPQGGTRVLDLPLPAVMPAGPQPMTWPAAASEVPDSIQAGALEMAAQWGVDPAMIEAGQREGGWRVVVGVHDRSGVRWPLTVWLTDLGESVWAMSGAG